MSEMVERIARILCGESPDGTDACTGDDGRSYPAGVPHWTVHVEEARHVLQTLREPSRAMVDAGVAFALNVTLSGEYRWSDYVADKHRSMIDAALAPSPSVREDGE